MKPTPKPKLEYEKVKTDDWTTGVIEDIQRDEKRNTGFKDEAGEEIIKDSIRFKFKLEGYQYAHYSNWMAFSYHEKAGLLSKYIFSLVAPAVADMDFDLERLKGMEVKVMWADKGEYQRVEIIRPVGKKIDSTIPF